MQRPWGGDLFQRRVTLFVGHFGSGKTEIAINCALDLSAAGRRVALADLDVVKPYFRSRSARKWLAEADIQLVAPQGENLHADLPIIVPQIRSLLRQGDQTVIMDVGGDDTGARVLGSLADVLDPEETDTLLVLNFRRPSTPGVDEAVEMVRRIEVVSRTRITGLVSNTHLMNETTADLVDDGYRLALETSQRLGVPVVAIAAQDTHLKQLDPVEYECQILALRRILLPQFEQTLQQRATGPLFVLN
ncbi:MAG: cobalamin biosynthesis protein CbiA [bacterium]|nr:cobalamin biosynthesis protein CbiA [bacterium]